ncbi:MAG TPA: hypothetical protein ENK09_05670 [Nitrospirae bacterium]|nr:hypothetical protein [Nitrospirota bacterium]
MKDPLEYINDALYFVVLPARDGFVYCSGVNISQFLPITRGRHKAMSNPAIRGLQIINLEIRTMALTEGATPVSGAGQQCRGIAPTDDIWYTESLYIKDPPEGFAERVVVHAATSILGKINKAIMLGADLPEGFLPPERLYSVIQGLCRQYGS